MYTISILRVCVCGGIRSEKHERTLAIFVAHSIHMASFTVCVFVCKKIGNISPRDEMICVKGDYITD